MTNDIVREKFVGPQQEKISEIIKNKLYVGNFVHSTLSLILTSLGIKRIVNVTDDLPCLYPTQFDYYHLKVADRSTENMMVFFDEICKFIDESPGPVLIHCQMGISRSATVAMAYVGKRYGVSSEAAYNIVKSHRWCIWPNRGFMNQLKTYLD